MASVCCCYCLSLLCCQCSEASFPSSVKVEVADELNESHLMAQLSRCQIIVGEPHLIAQHVHRAPQLQWIQLVYAGVDKSMNFVDIKTVPYRVTRAGGDSFGPRYQIQRPDHTATQLTEPQQNKKIGEASVLS